MSVCVEKRRPQYLSYKLTKGCPNKTHVLLYCYQGSPKNLKQVENDLQYPALSIQNLPIKNKAFEFSFYPCKMRTGILAGSCHNLGGNPKKIPGRNPGGIPARFSPGSKIPSSQNLSGSLPGISPRFLPESKNPGSQDLGVILLGISPKFSPGSKISAR